MPLSGSASFGRRLLGDGLVADQRVEGQDDEVVALLRFCDQLLDSRIVLVHRTFFGLVLDE